MVTKCQSLTIIVCLIYVPQITSAFLRKSPLYKRFGQLPGTQDKSDLQGLQGSKLFFRGDGFKPETLATRYGSIVLECEIGGSPLPTIHWLKNGVRIVQGSSRYIRDDEASYEDHRIGGNSMFRLSSTRSRLFLDCLDDTDEAQYTCVAENALQRKSRKTFLRVENPDIFMYNDVHKCTGKRSKRGEPARIYMWTVSRIEFENNKVQLFCRAEGTPKPTISWYHNDNPIQDDDNYKIADNGDLIIRDITWMENMGSYTCVADNILGMDTTEAFLYPTPREDEFGFPV